MIPHRFSAAHSFRPSIRGPFPPVCLLAFAVALAAVSAARAADDLNPVIIKKPLDHPPIVLVEDGKPKGSIVLPATASGTLSQAAQTLQGFIARATGATLPIVRGGKFTPPALVLGDSALAAEHGLAGKALPIEGFAIKTVPGHILIVGRDGAVDGTKAHSDGTAWGTYEFAERFVGVRWYFPGELGQSIPPTNTLAVRATWLEDAPVFRKREIWPPMSNPWNGSGTQLGALHTFLRHANSWPHTLVVHSPDWSKVGEYLTNRAEVFQLRSDGTRDFSMLCYGHPRTLETYLENIERHVAGKAPARVGIADKSITVSPADAEIACYCTHCRKLWNPSGGQYGSASKIVAQFTANLARIVKQRWPDMTVLYLPYLNYTDAPTGVDVPDNVEVQLCGMPGLAQYKEPAIAKLEQATIDQWILLTGHKIQNWHYSCWPEDRTSAVYLFPHTAQDFYRRNRDKTVGTFINGTTDHWPRQHLSLYCWMKMLWNPEFDVDAAINEYCRRLYGPAAATLRQLVELQITGWENSRWPSERLSPKAVHQTSFPRALVQQMESLLEQARKQAAGDATILQRIDYYAGPFAAFFKESKDYAEGTGLKPLVAMKVGENPVLDGQLTDAVWQRAPEHSFVRGWDKKQSATTYPTTVRAVWTLDGITFGFRLTEPTPELLERGIKGRDDSMAWWDDNLELLFDVTGKNEGEFYHLIINANNAVADAKGKDFSKDYPQIKSAVFVGQDFWSVEVYVPYAGFPEAAKPGSGTATAWFGNFTRHRVADQGLKPKLNRAGNSAREYQRLNTTYAGPSNNLADFAPIKFLE